jgi:hypothetical protein
VSQTLPDDVSLAAVGDSTTLAEFREKLVFLPSACVASACDQLERVPLRKARAEAEKLDTPAADPRLCGNYLQAFEASLASRLRQWRQEPRFAAAIEKHADRLKKLGASGAACRAALWRRQLKDLEGAGAFWEAYTTVGEFLAQLDNPESDPGFLYRFVDSLPAPQEPLPQSTVARIHDATEAAYVRMLPAAFERMLQVAQRNVNLSLRHGLSLALCGMMNRMLEPVSAGSRSEALAGVITRLEAQQAASVSYFEREVAPRSVVVQDMTSVIPGLGVTFAKDIQNGLRRALAESGLDRYVEVRPPDGPTGVRDLIVEGGHIASFEADETTATKETRTVERWGPVEVLTDSASRSRDVGSGGASDGKARFTQTRYAYAIHVNRIERVAHVRLSLRLRTADRSAALEINEFFRRSFVQEEMHPFADVRAVESVRAATAEELHEEEGPPELTHERIWTSSEMLDWARKETQSIAISELLYRLEAAPLRFSERAAAAETSGDWLAAADSWGYCYEYCRHLTLPTEAMRNMLDEESASSHRRQILERLLERQRALTRLKHAAENAMIDAATKVLDQTKPGVADVDRRPEP